MRPPFFKILTLIITIIPTLFFSDLSYAKQPKKPQKISQENIPQEHLLTIENDTDHQIYIREDGMSHKVGPAHKVTLCWDEPLSDVSLHTLDIYYAGNIPPKPQNTKSSKKSKSEKKRTNITKPSLIAQLTVEKPGTIALYYSKNGILEIERSA